MGSGLSNAFTYIVPGICEWYEMKYYCNKHIEIDGEYGLGDEKCEEAITRHLCPRKYGDLLHELLNEVIAVKII
jgi:hypothetical protein